MSIRESILRRGGLLAIALALTVAFVLPATASAQAGTEAAHWLASQLKPSETSSPAYCEAFVKGGPSVGETIECELAFKAAGSEFNSQRTAAYDYAVENKNEYIGTKSCSEGGEMHAGSVAKLALGVEAEGGNPEEVKGRNLIADLKCLQSKSGSEEGRIKDKASEEFSNTTTQSLAIIALKACEHGDCPTKPNLKAWIEPAGKYLRAQQCTGAGVAGAFRSTMGLAASECNTEPPFEPENAKAVEVDSTGAAVQALLAEGSTASKTAAEKGLTWLEANSHLSKSPEPSGALWENYCGETEFTKLFPSVNSTTLASMAFVQAIEPFSSAKEWLKGIVKNQPMGKKGLPACTASGEPNVFATAQGVLGLQEATYPHLVGLPLG